MKVELIAHTSRALETLIFTKQTRLKMTPGLFEEINCWSKEDKLKELQYMFGTIQSGFEFVDYVFLITDVSRAFTHQLVRHRSGTSFAQQAMRVVDMKGFSVYTGPSIDNGPAKQEYEEAMDDIDASYKRLQELGVKTEDARGVLPTNILTNIVFKANLRTLHDMGLKRLCWKAQGEFQEVFKAIKAEVVGIHEWAEPYLRVNCAFTGVCCFENVKVDECPVKGRVFNPNTGYAWDLKDPAPDTKDEIQALWEENFDNH